MAIFGYAGRILRVDLTSRTIWEEELREEVARFWVGGVGARSQVGTHEAISPLRVSSRRWTCSGQGHNGQVG